MKIEKHIPADTTLDIKTFLNDSKADGEMYAYLLSISIGEEGETRVYKNKIPTQPVLAEILAPEPGKAVNRKTISAHMKYLKDNGYLIDKDKYYIMPNVEKMFFKIPLDTLKFLLDTVKAGVIKTYTYLGQRNNYKPGQYVFTIKEICEHLGLNYQRQSNMVSNWLVALEKFGLITTATFYEGSTPRYRLIDFSTKIPKLK